MLCAFLFFQTKFAWFSTLALNSDCECDTFWHRKKKYERKEYDEATMAAATATKKKKKIYHFDCELCGVGWLAPTIVHISIQLR